MLLSEVWEFFQERIFPLPNMIFSGKPVFNLYHHEVSGVDRAGGAAIRRANLKAYLESFREPAGLLVVGEAPGWRGCRFSGVPFTSEAQLCEGALPFEGKATHAGEHPLREASARIIWQVLKPWYPGWIAWNALPLHLHQPEQPLTNRHPTRRELAWGASLLDEFYRILQPQHVLAVGQSAHQALYMIGVDHFQVRHPAHGGASDFQTGVVRLVNSITIGG